MSAFPPLLERFAASSASMVRAADALTWIIRVLAVLVVTRAAIFAAALILEPWSVSPVRLVPSWVQILQAAFFALLAFVLLRYGRSDPRAWALGVFILDAAATLVEVFVRAIHTPSLVTSAGLYLRTDAFQAAFLWFFATAFPKPPTDRRLSMVMAVGTGGALLLGVVLVATDLYARVDSRTDTLVGALANVLRRDSPGDDSDWYFTLQFLWLAPLLVVMPLKLGEAGPNDRRRFGWLVLGLVVGFAPLAANVLLGTLFPAYSALFASPAYNRARGIVIFLALTVVPLAAAYAALVQRTLDVRLVVRAAMQYVLARSFIITVSAVPFVLLILLVAANLARPVGDLFRGGLGLVLALLALAGLGAAISRRWVLTLLDKRFFRHQADVRATLLAVAATARQSTSVDELRDTVTHALQAAFHPATMVTTLAGADDQLHALDHADLPPLARASALAQLVAGSNAPFDVETYGRAIVERLPPHDREWLRVARAAILLPLRGAGDELLGLLAIGEKRSELPYTDEDRTLLAAVGSACGLALDRVLTTMRDASAEVGRDADPPGRECVECGTVLSANSSGCPCGGLLRRAAAPHTLADRLRFVQRIGSGGMGVVYRATDLRLSQARAVKTLPVVDRVLVSRLRREARAMARVSHSNLALLYGLEFWRGAPMLVMEFLEGGTLAERLHRGPLSASETVDLGVCLASALGVLHDAGILHRDVKPSNIGFTLEGTPRLLDFGLARLVPRTASDAVHAAVAGESTWSVNVSTEVHGIRGTPAYLSPQVLTGRPPTAQDDLWSLAVTLLEASTGKNPFHAENVATTVARVLTEHGRVAEATQALPPSLQEFFREVLGSPDARPASAAAFAHRLRLCSHKEFTHGQVSA